MGTSHKWVCPFCSTAQIITESNYSHDVMRIGVHTSKHGDLHLNVYSIGCSNAECDELSLQGVTTKVEKDDRGNAVQGRERVFEFGRRPGSSAMLQPDYVPEAIRQDYYEACAILNLSPKASATLSRRCLQGMIRDYCGISKPRLIDQVNALRAAMASLSPPRGVHHDTIDAIDAVRKVGNIAAQMETDTNVIVDVESGEASALLELLELLLVEWYAARDQRRKRLNNVKALAESMSQRRLTVANG